MRPLVVGSPRSGFALLGSVMSHLLPMDPPRLDLRQRLIRAVVRQLDMSVARPIEAVFAAAGHAGDLIYNGNFKTICGGPKWLKSDDPSRAAIRKYIGVRGMSDFTLIVSHPAEVLETDNILHSHSHPRLWTELPCYDGFVKLASVRNPVGIVNSSLFSINALTSEYIQRFMPPEDDNDEMRQRLALYKFTDLEFFSGIVRHYKGYFDEFLAVADRYHVMRWEDLILDPARTIARIASHAGLPVDEEHAGQIWQRLDHVNLTGAHQHNYRRGKGIVGDWRNWVTNRHLDVIRDNGLEPAMRAFGYGPIEPLDEAAYTPFQSTVADMLARGEIYRDYPDQDLFGFAFNKSNLDSSAFSSFKRYGWRRHTSIERSGFTDEAVVMAVWDAAEAAVGEINQVLETVLSGRWGSEAEARISLSDVIDAARPIAARMPKAGEAMAAEATAVVEHAFSRAGAHLAIVDPAEPPRLLRSWGQTNLVSYQGRFSAIPWAAGAIDLQQQAPETIPGAIVADSYRELHARLGSAPG